MKLKFIFFILSTLLSFTCVGQYNYSIKYKKVQQAHKVFNHFKKFLGPKASSLQDSLLMSASVSFSVLKGNNKKAVYYTAFQNTSEFRGRPVKTDQTTFFKDFMKNKNFQETKFRPELKDKNIVVKRKIKTFNWVLSNESKTINGFKCKKAIGTNKYGDKLICWYTDELGIIGAPEYFDGIPGLAIFIKDDKNKISYELIELKQPKQLKLKQLTEEYIEMTHKEFKNRKIPIREVSSYSTH